MHEGVYNFCLHRFCWNLLFKLRSAGLNYNLPSFFTESYCAGVSNKHCLLTFFIFFSSMIYNQKVCRLCHKWCHHYDPYWMNRHQTEWGKRYQIKSNRCPCPYICPPTIFRLYIVIFSHSWKEKKNLENIPVEETIYTNFTLFCKFFA